MAAPNDISISNLNGTWVMDKTRSTNLDAIFQLQGMGWIARMAFAAGTPSLKITQGSDSDPDPDPDSAGSLSSVPTEWVLLEPGPAGVLKAAPDKRVMTWTESEYTDNFFGRLVIRSRYIAGEKTLDDRVRPLVEIQTGDLEPDVESILTEAMVITTDTAGQWTVEKAFIHDFARSMDSGWTAESIWAVESIGGETMLTRRVVVKKGSSTELARVFYTYQ
ncbi:hypothetical protein BJX65DRAFT_320002 [Aspergillus insuetus]